MTNLEAVPQAQPKKEGILKFSLSDNRTQIVFAKQWFKLHPEMAKNIEISPEHPKIDGNDILEAWVEHAAETYRAYLEYAERNHIEVDITDTKEVTDTLRDMGVLKTVH